VGQALALQAPGQARLPGAALVPRHFCHFRATRPSAAFTDSPGAPNLDRLRNPPSPGGPRGAKSGPLVPSVRFLRRNRGERLCSGAGGAAGSRKAEPPALALCGDCPRRKGPPLTPNIPSPAPSPLASAPSRQRPPHARYHRRRRERRGRGGSPSAANGRALCK